MAFWQNTTKTSLGLALDQKMLGGETGLRLTKAVSGAGKVNPTQLAFQTAVSGLAQTLELKDIVRSSEGTTVTIPVLLSNGGLSEGYSLYQVGIYAQDPDLGEILYFLAQTDSKDGEVVPSAADNPGFSITWNFALNVSSTDKVDVVLNEAGRLTLDQGDARYAKKADLEALNTKVDNIDITSQLTGYYTKTETDAKIAAAIEEEITSVLEGSF